MVERERLAASKAGTGQSAPAAKAKRGGTNANSSILWTQKPERWPVCAPGTARAIHVWAVPLDLGPDALGLMRATLSPAELRRAARFHFPQHRDRFIAARGVLRTALGQCLRTEARKLEFAYGPHGKPELAGPFGDRSLRFNLAHCENLALLAITNDQRIGVDLERIRLVPNMGELVTRFFSPRESAAFHALPEAQKPEAFFNLWTRKEAWLKATGEGISQHLAEVEVSFLPGEAAQVLHLPRSLGPRELWSLSDLRLAEDFAAAIAVEGPVPTLHCWHWDFENARTNQVFDL